MASLGHVIFIGQQLQENNCQVKNLLVERNKNSKLHNHNNNHNYC